MTIAHQSSSTRILWLIGSLVIGFYVGNIVFGLPFAFILFYGVPDNRWTAKLAWWRKLIIPLRAVCLVAAMYLFIMIFLILFGPWLTSGMGK